MLFKDHYQTLLDIVVCIDESKGILIAGLPHNLLIVYRYIPPPTTNGTFTSSETEKLRIESEVHRLVTARDKKYTNFIEYNNYKLIYRRYAGLFFTIAVDLTDNELSYLETIHLFVELLDSYFSNVCELDIVFNFNKVYSILDEYMLTGEIEETSKREILDRVRFVEKME